MVTDKMKWIGIGIVAVITIIIASSLIFHVPWGKSGVDINQNISQMINTTIDATDLNLNIQTSLEHIKINAKAPESRMSLPYYRAYYAKGDVEEKYFGELRQERYNLTSVEDAPEIARKVMEPYGGIPSDAYVSKSLINKAIVGDLQNPTKVMTFSNQIYFHKTINGIPITGMSDGMIVWLGDNGELLGYKKFWRTLEKMGDVPVVPFDKAIQKLEKREMMNPPQSPSDAVVSSVNLRYYATSWNAKEIYLEPVWDFYATLPSGNSYEFFVYARQFAGFSQTPAVTTKSVAGKSVQEKDPFTATFTDTSDANPTKWQWDFGDGTTSPEKNPTHKYKAAGTYNVTLTVWNDLGSDTMTQQYTVDGAQVKMADINSTVMLTETPIPGNETAIPTATTSAITANPSGTNTVNGTAPSPIPTNTVSITPTASLNIILNTTSGNSTTH